MIKKLSIDQITEIYYIRAALSCIAARFAARNLAEDEKKQLFILCDRMDTEIEHAQSKAMLEDNLRFHDIICKAAKSRRFEDLALQYHTQSERYQPWAWNFRGATPKFASSTGPSRRHAPTATRQTQSSKRGSICPTRPRGSLTTSTSTEKSDLYFRLMYFCESIVIAKTMINPFTLYWT